MCRGEPMRAIVSRFLRDVVENDRAVAQFAKCIFLLSLSINRHGIAFVDQRTEALTGK